MLKKLLLVLICGLMLFQAGCGGTKNKVSGEGLYKPWDLLTEEEAETLLGFDVESEIQKIDPLGQRIVFYGAVPEEEKDFIQICVVRNEDIEDSLKEQGQSVEKFFEEVKKESKETSRPVKDLGDQAFWNMGALHILSDNFYITISTANTDSPKYLERAKEVAETVLSRL